MRRAPQATEKFSPVDSRDLSRGYTSHPVLEMSLRIVGVTVGDVVGNHVGDSGEKSRGLSGVGDVGDWRADGGANPEGAIVCISVVVLFAN